MNANSSWTASSTIFGSSGNPVDSSQWASPYAFAAFCAWHSPSAVGPASTKPIAPVISSEACLNHQRTRPLMRTANSSTVGMQAPSCFATVTQTPRTFGRARISLTVPTTYVLRIFTQKPSRLGDLPAVHCHQRFHVTHSNIQHVSALKVCLAHELHLHESFALR